MLLTLTDQSSQEFGSSAGGKIWISAAGTGEVRVEIKAEGDDSFRAYPEASFEVPSANVVITPRGRYRITAVGGPVTVNIQEILR